MIPRENTNLVRWYRGEKLSLEFGAVPRRRRSAGRCPHHRLEAAIAVGTIAKRLVGRRTATTQRNRRLVRCDGEGIAFGVGNRHWSLDDDRSIVANSNANVRHGLQPPSIQMIGCHCDTLADRQGCGCEGKSGVSACFSFSAAGSIAVEGRRRSGTARTMTNNRTTSDPVRSAARGLRLGNPARFPSSASAAAGSTGFSTTDCASALLRPNPRSRAFLIAYRSSSVGCTIRNWSD